MKKSREILGLSVISIQEGKELGIVKKLVIDPVAGSVIAIFIDDGKSYLGAKALPFSAITGLGEYAVTVNSETNIVGASTYDIFLTQGIDIIGSLAITRDGNIAGTVYEILIDDDGKVVECLLTANEETSSVSAQRVITFGKDVLIIASDNAENPVINKQPVKAADSSADEVQQLYIEAEQEQNQPEQTEPDALAKMFEEKQRKYMLGKRASRRIDAEDGTPIVEQNEEITEFILQKAKSAGKFVELSMSIH